MRPIRILIQALIALSLLLPGAMAAGHTGVPEASMSAMEAQTAPSGHDTCCDEVSERSPACHVLPAMIPTSTAIGDAASRTRLVPPAPSILPSGHEPDGPLDPRRPA